MLAQITPPAEIAAWLACAAFVLMMVNGGFKLTRNFKGTEPQPPNASLGLTVGQLDRRVTGLEHWRDNIMSKLETDKQEILDAGEGRIERISTHIESVRRELDEKIDNVPDRVIATLKNTGAI